MELLFRSKSELEKPMVKQLKLFIQKFIQFFGYKLIGRKEFVKHNSFNGFINS